jgi:hypothetical protein
MRAQSGVPASACQYKGSVLDLANGAPAVIDLRPHSGVGFQ